MGEEPSGVESVMARDFLILGCGRRKKEKVFGERLESGD